MLKFILLAVFSYCLLNEFRKANNLKWFGGLSNKTSAIVRRRAFVVKVVEAVIAFVLFCPVAYGMLLLVAKCC